MIGVDEIQQIQDVLRTLPMEKRECNLIYNEVSKSITITNKCLSSIEANKLMQFECPNCKHTQITKAWNYTHNFCPHCGAEIVWNLSE